jgi:DNA transposition AAA+ family ATPase
MEPVMGTMTNKSGFIQPLQNVLLFDELVQLLLDREAWQEGIATFHGFAGYGKTVAATFAANTHEALYIEIGESWTKKKFCQQLLKELGVEPDRSIPDMVEQIIDRLKLVRKPLFIDEFDILVDKGYCEIVREIYNKTRASIVLIGEENLPQKILKASERLHSRILRFQPAQPIGGQDTAILAQRFANDIELSDDLCDFVAAKSGGAFVA